MLNAMREGAKSGLSKFILFSFMIMAVGGLVFMDIGGFFRGGINQSAVAKIGSQDLSITYFDRTLRRTLANQGLDTQTAYKLGLINQVLRSEISNNLLQRAAIDHGLEIARPTVLNQISILVKTNHSKWKVIKMEPVSSHLIASPIRGDHLSQTKAPMHRKPATSPARIIPSKI